MNNVSKEPNCIIWYLVGIVILIAYSLNKMNLHTNFSGTIISYTLLLTASTQLYGLIRTKKKDQAKSSMTRIQRIELVLEVVFICLFIYNVTI